MRFNAFIIACAICLTWPSEAAVRFTAPVWRPDLGISVPNLVGASAAPIDLPRAEAYLVTSSTKGRRLEDRFDTFGLWTAATVRGRWRDDRGNTLLLARLATQPPDDPPGSVRTRLAFREMQQLRGLDPKNRAQRDEAVESVSPVEVEKPVPPRRAQRKNLTELLCYPSVEKDNVLVYAFRPRSPERQEKPDWYLVVLAVAEGEDLASVRAHVDDEFLDAISIPPSRARRSPVKVRPVPGKKATESDLLRYDLATSVANYDEWCCSEADDVLVLDNLDTGVRATVVTAITNNLPRLRRAYAKAVPSPLSGTNAVATVRVFRSREEYLAYVGVEQKWTAALWSPQQRELVLYHPESGDETLLRTVWHEAFHQYLAYAGSMFESSPWFNEGHAKLFENSHFDWKGEIVFERDAAAAAFVHEYAADLATVLPSLFLMDYADFYAGEGEEVLVRYRLAWSIAYFLEVGAPKLRFRPYENFRADYLKALVDTHSMREATLKVLGDEKSRDAFVAAWLAFWREN
ncbi:MAG: hypothetical protein MJ249_10355 [Kiritimatiellae bacterium]|nr:hypothetical protein [Kiritimatiellia bacterium]